MNILINKSLCMQNELINNEFSILDDNFYFINKYQIK